LVFFDWDKYNITPKGMQVIQLAANQYKSGGSARLQVTGCTDSPARQATTNGSPSGVPMQSPALSNGSACSAAT
jgi:hypothetical protein